MAMDNYTVLDQGKSYCSDDFNGFRKYRTKTNEVLFVQQYRSLWEWPEHKTYSVSTLKNLYRDKVMTRLIAHRLGLCEDSLYKNYTPENFLVDITDKHDLIVYDSESVYTYIFFFRDSHSDADEARVNVFTKKFVGLDDQQQSVMKELIDKISLKDDDLEKIADYVFDHTSSADLRDVKNDILTYGIEHINFDYLYDEYLFDIEE